MVLGSTVMNEIYGGNNEFLVMACCMHTGEEEFIQGFGVKARRTETTRKAQT
jgi:hypothetical protein